MLFDSRVWISLAMASHHSIDFMAWEKDFGSWFSMILVRKAWWEKLKFNRQKWFANGKLIEDETWLQMKSLRLLGWWQTYWGWLNVEVVSRGGLWLGGAFAVVDGVLTKVSCRNDHTCATWIIIQIKWNMIIDRISIVKKFIIIDSIVIMVKKILGFIDIM